MIAKKVDLIVDLQFGSTGKGALAGYLSTKNNYDVVITANMPNAGHTFIDAEGQTMIHKVLPSGIASPGIKWVLIAPGAIFDEERLIFERNQAADFGYEFRLGIHEHAIVLSDQHKMLETNITSYKSIGSTQQGSAEAMMHKIRRDSEEGMSPLAKDVLGMGGNVISHAKYLDIIYQAESVLAEGAQGYSLGLNAGFWPYCTSRDCTPARFCADMLIPMPWVRNVYGSARTYPIRVGGTSGPGYRDQTELKWSDLGQTPELTTVTKRERRVFDFSKRQMWEAMLVCQPTHVFLNFCNYMEDKQYELGKIIDWIDEVGAKLGCGGVGFLGWGPTVNDIKDIREAEDIKECINCGAKTPSTTSTPVDDSTTTEESISS